MRTEITMRTERQTRARMRRMCMIRFKIKCLISQYGLEIYKTFLFLWKYAIDI